MTDVKIDIQPDMTTEVTATERADVRSYLRQWAMPHVLCPGCAHGIVLRSFLEAVDQLQLDQDKIAMVAGIGCSSRLADTSTSAPFTEPMEERQRSLRVSNSLGLTSTLSW